MRLFAAVVMVITLIAAAIFWLTSPPAPAQAAHLELSSDPFPLTVGNTRVLVALTDANGQAVDNATIELYGEMVHPGMLPVRGSVTGGQDGVYRIPVTWSMSGEWKIELRATFPDSETVLQESFVVFIYSILMPNPSTVTTYRSLNEQTAMQNSSPEELRIIIPLGTNEKIRNGMGQEIFPAEIFLKLSGQHTLVIQNDDIANHSVGPFFIHAGETLRQAFTRPAVYVGACTILHEGEIRIVVEE